MNAQGNFVDESTHQKPADNILYMTSNVEDLAKHLQLSRKDLIERLNQIRQKLDAHREKRVHPYKDDKILTDWNGLMIAALARGGRVLGNKAYTDSAIEAAEFILKNDG